MSDLSDVLNDLEAPARLTRVVNLRTAPFDIYVGRAGRGYDGYFGNPFRIENDVGEVRSRAEVIHIYRNWFLGRLKRDSVFERRVLELRGKVLGCFCKPEACHGDVIAEYLNGLEG